MTLEQFKQWFKDNLAFGDEFTVSEHYLGHRGNIGYVVTIGSKNMYYTKQGQRVL